jgi:N-acyl-D-amino-acid deacylase
MRTLFKNGLIIDGGGGAPYRGDLLTDGERIAAVGSALTEEADETVDCSGLYVCPGLIDAHSHNDFFYDREDSARFYRPFLEQGITTQVTGNCSFSPFGVEPGTPFAGKVGGGLFRAVNPGSYRQFRERAAGNLYVNLAPLIGHGTVRVSVSGLDPKPLGSAAIRRELRLVDEAMEGGAFGGSFGFMYEPDMYSTRDEVRAFASEIAKYDGIVAVHPRACSRVSMGYPMLSPRPHIELGLDEVAEIMKKTGVRMEYSRLIFVGRSSWSSCKPMLKKFHELNARGFSIGFDNYSLTYGASVITAAMPPWYLALPESEKKKPAVRRKLSAEVSAVKTMLGTDYGDMRIAYISPEHPEYEGRTVAELASAEGLSGFDMYVKLTELSKAQGRIYLGRYYSDEIVRTLMEDKLSVFMTDAWVEEAGAQNSAAFQCFPYFFVRAREYGIPPESVVRKMTGQTADRFRIPERGYLRPGFFADVSVLDIDGMSVDLSVPASRPRGVKHVYVNGERAVKDGEFCGLRCGRVLSKK